MFLERFLAATLVVMNHSVDEGNDGILLELLQKIEGEKHFENLVLSGNCLGESVLKSLQFPIVFLSSNNDCILSETDFNREMIILHCLGSDFELEEFRSFVHCLGHLRESRIIFIWGVKEPENTTDVKLVELLKQSCQLFLPNVISVYKDLWQTKRFFTYKRFPTFNVVNRHLNGKVFPNQLEDMQGADLLTYPDDMMPRTFIYSDEKGFHVTGYVARVIEVFAKKHNATLKLKFALNQETNTNYVLVLNLTMSCELDIPMSITSPVVNYDLQRYSSVVEQASWFPMIPLAPPTPVYKIFVLIIISRLTAVLVILWFGFSGLLTFFDWLFVHQYSISFGSRVTEFLLNMTSLFRGLLGQSITLLEDSSLLLKIIYGLLFISGMFLGTVYNAYLQTFMTSPPKPKEINTFDDLLKSKVPVVAHFHEIQSIEHVAGEKFWRKYSKIFSSSEKEMFLKRRISLDTSAAFLITSSLWPVLDQYQSYLARLRFHHPQQMYFTKSLYLCIPQHEHSIYKSALNTVILQLQESGLLTYWRLNSFKDSLLAGRMNITREWISSDPRGLSMEDCYWVWLIGMIGLSIGLVIFLGELAIDAFL